MAKGLAIILAAGEGTRMRSQRPKVMHEVGNQPMIAHVAAAARAAELGALALVVGPDMAAVAAAAPDARAFVQAERRGTAHAVLAARQALSADLEDVVVLLGDAPLVRPQTIAAARQRLAGGADLVVVGFRARDPFGYGRLVVEGERVRAIREERDASETERSIDFCNSGIMAFSARHMLALVEAIGNDNAKNEFYLTDAIQIADDRGLAVVAIEADEDEVMGINDRAQLARCEALFQARMRAAALAAGVTLAAPETVFFSADTVLGSDVTVEQNVVFGPRVTVETGARIRAFSHLEGARVDSGAIVGPFARLRPGAEIGAGARIGNFVEVKNATFGSGAKANHLAYVGDATVGAGANIGAGTITCNYDGILKYETRIGADAFIGSNSALVAPVSVGEGAYVGSGSVITEDVPADALAIGRGRQVVKEGRAKAFREEKLKEKGAAKEKG